MEVRDRRSLWIGRLLDAIGYALVLTAAVFLATTAVSFLLGTGLVGTKYGMFIVGWLGLGYSGLKLRPTPLWKREGERPLREYDEGRKEETRFRAFVQRVPPARFRPLHPTDRFSTATTMFIGSATILLTSFLLEVVFRVGYG